LPSRREGALEVVEGLAPSVLVRTHGLLVPQTAVLEVDGGEALVCLFEIDLDQLARAVAVPDPGEREAIRRVDLRVAAAAAVLDVLVGGCA